MKKYKKKLAVVERWPQAGIRVAKNVVLVASGYKGYRKILYLPANKNVLTSKKAKYPKDEGGVEYLAFW